MYRLQEVYQPTVDTTEEEEEEEEKEQEEAVRKEKKFIVFESCLLKLLQRYCSCGQGAELNISVKGTLHIIILC